MKYLLALILFAFPLMAANISEKEASDIAVKGYIYGYPLVTMELTRRAMTNTATPRDGKAPMGQFFHFKKYPDPSFTDVTTPNSDTLYSTAWLDLSKEPYIFHLPDTYKRYVLFPILNAWTDVFESIGTRTTGGKGGDYAIVGPKWNGILPRGVKEVRAPTNLVWIIGRTYSSGTPDDYLKVHELQRQYTLTPLSFYGKSYTPPAGHFDTKIDMKTPVRDQVNGMDGAAFFNLLAQLMKENPPKFDDTRIVGDLARIGVVIGKEMKESDPAIINAPKAALSKIAAQKDRSGKIENGWRVSTEVGSYGTNYLQRAYVAAVGLGANLPEDAIYPMAVVDNKGQPLTGEKKYRIHFNKDELPPVKGFWSVTMYNDHLFFVPNALNRYTISLRDKLKFNADGSLDIYVQHQSPGSVKESNWLPAPQGKFELVLRAYWPEEAIIDGSWQPPTIEEQGA